MNNPNPVSYAAPSAVQRKRTKDWRMPANTKCVTRPGPFGNPFYVAKKAEKAGDPFWCADPADAVAKYESMVLHDERLRVIIRRELRGFNLACYCNLHAPCHRAVLLRIANDP